MSLLNAVQNNQENRVGSSPGSVSNHHNSSQHQHIGMSGMKQPHSGSGNAGVYGQERSGMGTMHVKPEVQQQHSVDSIESGNHARSPVTPGTQRSPASLGGHGMEGSLVDACSRYGISGSISTPTSPDCNASSGYSGMSHQQSHNPYSSGNRSSSLSSSYGGHCLPNPFNFTVNNLIQRNHKI